MNESDSDKENALFRASMEADNRTPIETGRYYLEEAANAIIEGAGVAVNIPKESREKKVKEIETMLTQGVKNGLLPVFRPGEDIPYHPDIIRVFYEETHCDDMNQWLAICLPRVEIRFPKPPKIPPPPKESAKERNQRISEAALDVAKRLNQEGKKWNKKRIARELIESFPNIDQATIERAFEQRKIKSALVHWIPPEKK